VFEVKTMGEDWWWVEDKEAAVSPEGDWVAEAEAAATPSWICSAVV